MNFEIDLQQKINQFRQSNPSVKNLPDEQILSIMIKQGAIRLTDAQKLSIYAHNDDNQSENNTGLELERTIPCANNHDELIISRHSTQKKHSPPLCVADQLANTYFLDRFSVTNTSFCENRDIIFQASDGNKYNLNNTLSNRIENTSTNLQKAEDDNGFIGSAWSWFKNTTGIGASSDKVRDLISTEEDLLKKFNENPQDRAQIFKQLTGEEYSDENLEKFIKGEIKLKSEIALGEYSEGQNMALDICADIVSGVAAVGIYTASVAAAPFTGGTSIAVGLAAATASGAAIKTGLKYADAKSAGREYNSDDLQHDMVTGGFSGALAPVTGGLGGAVGKTVATKLGVQAVKQVGKEVAEEAAKGGLKAGLKTALTNPTGYEYLGGSTLKRGTALAAEFATDGALGGSIDGAFRTAYDGGDINDVTSAAVGGFVGGALFAPVIGGGMKAVGKGAQKAFGKNDAVIDSAGKTTERLSHHDFKNLESSINKRLKEAGIDPKKIEINDDNIQLIDRIAHQDYISERMGLARLDPSPIKTKEQATVAGLFLDLVADKNTMDLNYLDRIAFNNIVRHLDDPDFASALYSFLCTIKNNDLLRNNESLKSSLGSILNNVHSPEALANINKLLDTFLSDERLLKPCSNSGDIHSSLGAILNNVKNAETADGMISILEKILSSNELINNPAIMAKLGNILTNLHSREGAACINKILDKYLSAEDTYKKSYPYTTHIANVLTGVEYPYSGGVNKVVDKIFSKEDLYKNFNIICGLDLLIHNTTTTEQADTVCKIIDKIIDNKLLPESSGLIGSILGAIKTPEHAVVLSKFIEQYLSDEKLYNNKNIREYIGNFIYLADTPENAQNTIQLLSRYSRDENLCNNKELLEALKQTNLTKERYEAINKFLDKYLSDKRIYQNPDIQQYITPIIASLKSINHAETINTALDKFMNGAYSPIITKYNIGEFIHAIKTPASLKIWDKIINSDLGYYVNGEAMRSLGRIETQQAGEHIDKIIDKVLGNKLLSDIVRDRLGYIPSFFSIKTEKQAESINLLLDNILKNPDIQYTLHQGVDTIDAVASSTEIPEQLNRFFDVYFENKLYLSNENGTIYNYVTNIRQNTTNPKYQFIWDKLNSRNKIEQKEAISLLCYSTPENIEFLNKLSTSRKYNQEERMLIANSLPQGENQDANKIIEIIDEIFFDKNYDYIPFEHKVNITKYLNTKNIDDIKDFLTSSECKALPKEYIANIAININSVNKALAKELCNAQEFPKKNISFIIGQINKENEAFARELCTNPNFPKDDISSIIEKANKENESLIRELCQNPRFSSHTIYLIALFYNKDNAALATELCRNSNFPVEHISEIIEQANKENEAFIKELCNNADFPKKLIPSILRKLNFKKESAPLIKELCFSKDFPKECIPNIAEELRPENVTYATKLCRNHKGLGITPNEIPFLVENYKKISLQEYLDLKKLMGDDINKFYPSELLLACQTGAFRKTNINEIPFEKKKEFLRILIEQNSGIFNIREEMRKNFPLLPTTQEEYCTLLPALVKSFGVDIKPLKKESIEKFNKDIKDFASKLAALDDMKFNELTITQNYSKDAFIKDVLEKTKDLSENERRKVFDYFGFEIKTNPNSPNEYSIIGYPANLNNGKKLSEITDSKTKEIVENVRNIVIRFSENNPIISDNKDIEKLLNNIAEALPEIRTSIGKTQHTTHSFDIMKHSLKVMQKLAQDPKFKELNPSDQKIMLLASLLHDITKAEGLIDPTHGVESSFDSFFLAKKFNLSSDEKYKLFTLIRHHEWLKEANTAQTDQILTHRLKSISYDLRQDNLLDMALMFTHADLKAVKTNDSFHDTIRPGAVGKYMSYGEAAEDFATRLREYVNELKKSQPLLPVTRIPKTSKIKEAITHVNKDGSTNIKGVYLRDDGLVVLKFNEIEDWETIGFPKGSVSRGYKSKVGAAGNIDVDTGNIKFFVHGLDFENQLIKFDAFKLPDSSALLSVSYAERAESKFRFFRSKGVLLDADTKYLHGGGATDSGSGFKKTIETFKNEYILGAIYEVDRVYISNLIKGATGMSDAEYIAFVEKYANKPLSEIEPPEVRKQIIEAFAQINSNERKGERSYNEMYVSNIKDVMGVFAYNEEDGLIGNPINFLSGRKDTDFLQKHALEKDIPFIIFGD